MILELNDLQGGSVISVAVVANGMTRHRKMSDSHSPTSVAQIKDI